MKEFDRLLQIMQRLRDPKKGCPWDLQQDEASLREYILEEAHELVEAIDAGDDQELNKELGDLLLQIIFLAQIAGEKERFSMRDVVVALSEKLIRRHPHIFASGNARSAEEVKQNWEKIKMAERRNESILSDYPEQMPALLTAGRVAAQAASVGFDWSDALLALEKVKEEIAELEAEIRARQPDKTAHEIGDLIFAMANVARLLKVNPELALKHANRKFVRRFRAIETRLREQGKTFADTNLAEMENLWQLAKRDEEK